MASVRDLQGQIGALFKTERERGPVEGTWRLQEATAEREGIDLYETGRTMVRAENVDTGQVNTWMLDNEQTIIRLTKDGVKSPSQ